jgi:hypothetical protein
MDCYSQNRNVDGIMESNILRSFLLFPMNRGELLWTDVNIQTSIDHTSIKQATRWRIQISQQWIGLPLIHNLLGWLHILYHSRNAKLTKCGAET